MTTEPLAAVLHRVLTENAPNGCDHHADEYGPFAQCEFYAAGVRVGDDGLRAGEVAVRRADADAAVSLLGHAADGVTLGPTARNLARRLGEHFASALGDGWQVRVGDDGLRAALERIRDLCDTPFEQMRAEHGSEQRVLVAIIPAIIDAALAASPAPTLDHALHFDPDCEECVYLARPTVVHVRDEAGS